MANLFIIGNGFDLSHNLKTAYDDFHSYLKQEYPNIKLTDNVPEYITDGHGEDVADEDEVIGFIRYLLDDAAGDKWSDLEESVGELRCEDYIPEYGEDKDDDNPWHKVYFTESWAMSLVKPIVQIPKYFNNWISNINIKDAIPKKDFIKLVKKNDLILSFNYTKTIEYLYGIDNVCHIHGVQGEELFFGHGKDMNYFSEDNYGMIPGTEDSFQEIHDKLKKNTQAALSKNQAFFETLGSSFDKIYSYGFSFSEVDEIYIREICIRLDTEKITWYLNEFDNEVTRYKYQVIIIKCGFKGTFNTYKCVE